MGINPLTPSVSLLCKLGSIAVHAQEMQSPGGNQYDLVAMNALLTDAEVAEWMKQMRALAMLPVKR